MRWVLAALLLLAGTAAAVEPAERLADPALEARARAISRGLRCLVCQNESIDESHADLAHDVRVLLRERLAAGDTDDAAEKYIVDRYGDFVLLQPPFRPATVVLWLGPPVLLAGVSLGMVMAFRRRRTPAAAPLSEAEQARLTSLLREDEG